MRKRPAGHGTLPKTTITDVASIVSRAADITIDVGGGS
jgi:hypothetical protein